MVVKSRADLDSTKLDEMNAVGQNFASKISRGISFYFSWVDASTDSAFAGVLSAPDG